MARPGISRQKQEKEQDVGQIDLKDYPEEKVPAVNLSNINMNPFSCGKIDYI